MIWLNDLRPDLFAYLHSSYTLFLTNHQTFCLNLTVVVLSLPYDIFLQYIPFPLGGNGMQNNQMGGYGNMMGYGMWGGMGNMNSGGMGQPPMPSGPGPVPPPPPSNGNESGQSGNANQQWGGNMEYNNMMGMGMMGFGMPPAPPPPPPSTWIFLLKKESF